MHKARPVNSKCISVIAESNKTDHPLRAVPFLFYHPVSEWKLDLQVGIGGGSVGG
jgi:hypothetical protein